jgi:hypothetical protein
MKKRSIAAGLFVAVLTGLSAASAQTIIPPGGSQFNPPLPPPPPSPRITVPVVPQMDALPSYNYVPAPRPSFGEKIATCLQEGAAAGLGPSDREVYSRACANSR